MDCSLRSIYNAVLKYIVGTIRSTARVNNFLWLNDVLSAILGFH